jgi:hypothetical protein
MAENAHFPAVDPKVTESFLLSQKGVLDASVWYVEGVMHAHVTLSDLADWTPHSLRLAVACDLGIHYTPREFVVLNARQRTA